MTTITIYTNQNQEYVGFVSDDHSEYDDAGKDIVCAGISALILNTVNSLENFTEDKFDLVTNEEDCLFYLKLKDAPSHDALLLLKSLVLGLQGIQNFYGNEYISLIFKEV